MGKLFYILAFFFLLLPDYSLAQERFPIIVSGEAYAPEFWILIILGFILFVALRLIIRIYQNTKKVKH